MTNILWAFILTILVFFQVKHVNAQSLYLNSRLDFDEFGAGGWNIMELNPDSILICGNAFNYNWSGIGFMGINSSGTKLWQKKHNAQHKIYYPGLVGSMKAFNGQYVLCGSIRDATNHSDVGFFRFSNQGDSLQFMSFGDSAYQEGASLEIAADSGFFLIGTNTSAISDPDGDFWLIKLNKEGEFEWEKFYGGITIDQTRCSAICHDGGVVMAGFRSAFGSEISVVRVDAEGNLLWERQINGNGREEAWSIHETSDLGFILSGYYGDTIIGAIPNIQFIGSSYLGKLDSNGNVIWGKEYMTPSVACVFFDVIENTDGSFTACGSENIPETYHINGTIIKVDANGDSIWSHRYYPNGDSGGQAELSQIIHAADGGYWAVGYCRLPGKTEDIWVLHVDSNGCETPYCAPLGVSYVASTDLEMAVYPNPTTGEVTFTLPEGFDDQLNISIYDLGGKTVYQSMPKAQFPNVRIDLSGLSGGLYLYQIFSSDYSLNGKIMIVK